jgi:hypothetical protein
MADSSGIDEGSDLNNFCIKAPKDIRISRRRKARTTWITLTPMGIGINMRVKGANIPPPGWQA